MNLLIPPPILGAIAALLMGGIAALAPGLSFAFAGQSVLAAALAAGRRDPALAPFGIERFQ